MQQYTITTRRPVPTRQRPRPPRERASLARWLRSSARRDVAHPWLALGALSLTWAGVLWLLLGHVAPSPAGPVLPSASGGRGIPVCPLLRAAPTYGVSLLDVQTGQPLCERNAEAIAQPASTTKVMAALLVGEYLPAHHLSLDTQVRVQPPDLQVESDSAVAGLRVGQRYSVHLLLAMASILSAADAVMTLARLVAGSRNAFLALMNERARQLGMTQTQYSSPYGYARTPAGDWQEGEAVSVGTYSSAHDLALLLRAFAQVPSVAAIFGLSHYEEASWVLDRQAGAVLPDSWGALQLPFQVVAVKKGCMWCDPSLHKLSYGLLIQQGQREVAAAFLYTTQSMADPHVGDLLPTLLWALHDCRAGWAQWC